MSALELSAGQGTLFLIATHQEECAPSFNWRMRRAHPGPHCTSLQRAIHTCLRSRHPVRSWLHASPVRFVRFPYGFFFIGVVATRFAVLAAAAREGDR